MHEDIISITQLKTEAAEIVREVAESRSAMTVTQNGEAKVVLVGLKTWKEQQETLAMLKLIAMSQRDIAAGRVRSSAEAFERARASIDAIAAQSVEG